MYTLESLKERDVPQAFINGKWVPARPLNHTYRTLLERFKEAWFVFIGKADAVIWPEGQ